MTIKELKEIFPQDKYAWHGEDIGRNTRSDDYNDNDIVVTVDWGAKDIKKVFVYWKAKPKPTLSKDNLDKVIQLNRQHFKAPFLDREKTWEKLKQAEKDCGEEIYDTSILDIISAIVLSTRAHDTPNEIIYKVYEALGYEVE